MHNALRGVIVGSLMCLAVPVLPQSALADTTSEAAATAAYFWRGKLPSTISIGGQTQPNPINGQDTDADGVARDELAVAVTAPGQTDKETFLAWDLFDLTEDDVITKFVVTSPLSESGPSPEAPQNTVSSGGTAALQACAAKEGFGPTDAGAYELKPEADLTKCAPGTFDEATSSYSFDITAIAAGWLTGDNYGIGILPADLTRPFQVVFKPVDAHLAAITYTPGQAPDDELLDTVETDLGGTGTTTTTFDSGFSSGGESVLGSAPMTSFDAPLAADEPLPAAEPVAAEEPVTAPVQVASVARTVPSGPPLGFWLLAAVLGMALFAMSLATGAPLAATAAGSGSPRREGRVLKHVQQMSLSRGTA